jgi:hypothetical protein
MFVIIALGIKEIEFIALKLVRGRNSAGSRTQVSAISDI